MSGHSKWSTIKRKKAAQDAKRSNMFAKLLRAIEGAKYEEVTYEGYGPGGVAVLVACLTDNRNRTTQEVRHAFTRNGGNLGEAGSTAWMFARKGVIPIKKAAAPEEEQMLELSR